MIVHFCAIIFHFFADTPMPVAMQSHFDIPLRGSAGSNLILILHLEHLREASAN